MCFFLFDLLKKFSLCFAFPDSEFHLLIPELLDKQEPELEQEFTPEGSLNFQYQYSILPEGLIPRFIVRTHILSEGLPRWRTGVILKFENSRALVRADVLEKKIYISIAGQQSSRRRLLAIIRSYFEEIHRNFPRLDTDEMVPLPDYPQFVISYEKLLGMERAHIETLQEFINNKVVELNIADLLNGLSLDEAGGQRNILPKRKPLKLFCSYSHKDDRLRNEFETHLKLLQRQGIIELWHDRRIDPGNDWRREIDINLEHADIIALLVSSDFIASDYCYEMEMKRAMVRQSRGEARVVPIIIRDVFWKNAPFATLQALPDDGLAITKWPDRDTAWGRVTEGIDKIANEILGKLSQ